ncbi:MAG: phage tail protein [Clostridia bacterium]|nr:phage tail protein [Clostridia bacterium]
MPRLLGKDLTEKGRLHPERVELTLSLTPLSTATLLLTPEDGEVAVGEYVELYTVQGTAGIFRVMSVTLEAARTLRRRVYCEHALVTLADTLLFGYTELGGRGMPMASVISTLLSGQSMWAPGDTECDTQFAYAFENENVLSALLSLTGPVDMPMGFFFSMETRPWKVHLRRLDTKPVCELRLKRNTESVKVETDMSDLVTRIYPLGYGEGADQMTIRDVNGGVPYLDADTTETWGIVQAVYTEPTMDDPETLKAAAKTVLEKRKNPKVTVTASALALSRLTGEPLDNFTPGALCRLAFPKLGYTEDARILSCTYPDVYGTPLKVSLTIGNRTELTEDELSRLSRRSSISELYAQGAASEYAVHFGDNADGDHPATLRFYLDHDAIHVNRVTCRYLVRPFRGYTKGESGGGSGSLVTGGITASVQVPEMTITTGYNIASATEGRHTHNAQTSAQTLSVRILETSLASALSVQSHTHQTAFGIFESGGDGEVQVTVDGNAVPASAISGGSFDALPYLKRDETGKILRGTWHEVAFTPTGLARIEADLSVRTFLRSLTGAVL